MGYLIYLFFLSQGWFLWGKTIVIAFISWDQIPLKSMSSSVGMIIPNIWKIKNGLHHQPDGDIYI